LQPNPKKAPMAHVIGAFFVVVCFALAVGAVRAGAETCASLSSVGSSVGSSAMSPKAVAVEQARVEYVYDGDTLRLSDGRKVRLLGINTPELARPARGTRLGQPAQPLAGEATEAVNRWLQGSRVQLLVGREREDRYGRLLAHVFNQQGQSLEASLLQQGLAFMVVIPPNTHHADCYQQLEAQARGQRLGIWAHPAWQPMTAKDVAAQGKTGFLRVTGTVTRVDQARDLWIELDHALVLRVLSANRAEFSRDFVADWQKRSLVVRGWVVRRKLSNSLKAKGFKEFVMTVKSPYAFEGDRFSQKNDLFGG
jgi:endonuclease YncB( thermonuclease family)